MCRFNLGEGCNPLISFGAEVVYEISPGEKKDETTSDSEISFQFAERAACLEFMKDISNRFWPVHL